MLEIVEHACREFLTSDPEFWVLAALTDRSFEEGERNAAFRESIDWYERAGIPSALAARLRAGINRNLASLIEKSDSPPDNLEYNPTRGGQRPDICFGSMADGTATIVEVKAAFDLTMDKWYPIIAADADKLRALGKQSACHLLQVVFFVQLPGFEYPAGQWYDPKWKSCPRRAAFPGHRGIEAQYRAARRLLPAPAWPAEPPFVVQLALQEQPLVLAVQRWCEMIFRPASPWTFDLEKHLAGAAAGCAISQH